MPSRRTSDHYIPTLDGWRAIAIALVMAVHASDSLRRWLRDYDIDFYLPPGLGTLGVQIFFALSGFLITTKMLDAESGRNGFSLRDFYLRRVFRILPASLTFLAIVGALALAGMLPVTLGRWLATVFLLANYAPATGTWFVGHFWSLAVEEHFYLLWPLAFVMLRSNGRRLATVCVAALAVAIWRAVAFKFELTYASPSAFWARTDIVADGILLGVAIALVYRSARYRERLQAVMALPATPYVLVLAVVGLEWAPVFDWKLVLALLSVKFALLPLMILSTVCQPRSIFSRLLEWRALRWVGLISYSLYLYQQLFLVEDMAAPSSLGAVQGAPWNIVFAVIAGYLSYRLIETPMVKLGHRVLGRRTRAAQH